MLCVSGIINEGKGYLVFGALAETDQVGSWLTAGLVEALVTLLRSLLSVEELVIDGVLALFVKFAQRTEHRDEDAAVCLCHGLVSFAEGCFKSKKIMSEGICACYDCYIRWQRRLLCSRRHRNSFLGRSLSRKSCLWRLKTDPR